MNEAAANPYETSPYEIALDRNAANYVPLSPIGFLRRSASVYPNCAAAIPAPPC
jgi:fatty-acyl-CoA synthase